MAQRIDDLLQHARSTLHRLTPGQVAVLVENGELLVDIRPHAQRLVEGEIPNAVIIERNVLEWRIDLYSEMRIPQVTSHEQPIVVVCSQGYTSSLAASALQSLGFVHATDVEGGFEAWKAGGFPVKPGGSPAIA